MERISRVSSGKRFSGLAAGSSRLQSSRLNHVDRVVAGAGDKQAAIGSYRHLVGADADADVAHLAARLGVDHAYAAAPPVRYIQVSPVAAECTGVRVHLHVDRRLAQQRIGIDGPYLVTRFIADVEFAADGMHGDAGEKDVSSFGPLAVPGYRRSIPPSRT